MQHYLLDGMWVCGEPGTDPSQATTDLLAVTCPSCRYVLSSVGAYARRSSAPPDRETRADDTDPSSGGRS